MRAREQHGIAQGLGQRQRIEFAVRQIDERLAERLQVVAVALAFALAGASSSSVIGVGSVVGTCLDSRRIQVSRRAMSESADRHSSFRSSDAYPASHATCRISGRWWRSRSRGARLGATEAEVGVSVDTGLSVTARLRRSRDAGISA